MKLNVFAWQLFGDRPCGQEPTEAEKELRRFQPAVEPIVWMQLGVFLGGRLRPPMISHPLLELVPLVNLSHALQSDRRREEDRQHYT